MTTILGLICENNITTTGLEPGASNGVFVHLFERNSKYILPLLQQFFFGDGKYYFFGIV